MRYALGIDLGTTYTGVAVGLRGHTEMVSLGNRSLVAPTAVFAREGGGLVTGDMAIRRGLEHPDRLAQGYKRRLGDPTPILVGGSPYSPAILLAAGLSAAVVKADEVNGEPAEQVVLTYPAVWGPYRREQFGEVPGLSGLRNVQTIAEPIAAAAYYAAARPHREGDVIAVYDLGGGTFDATVVRLLDGKSQILGEPEGIEWLGGIDFDEAILGYVDRVLGGAVTALNPLDAREAATLGRLRHDCTLAKEALSIDEEVTIRVFLNSGEFSVTLTRAVFQESIRPALNSTIEAMHRVLSSAAMAPEELSAVLLIGGSSRIPLVADMVRAALGRPVVIDAHPKHAVALGAAIIGAAIIESDEARDQAAPTVPTMPTMPAMPTMPTMPIRRTARQAIAAADGSDAPDQDGTDPELSTRQLSRRRARTSATWLDAALRVALPTVICAALIAVGILAGLYTRGYFR